GILRNLPLRRFGGRVRIEHDEALRRRHQHQRHLRLLPGRVGNPGRIVVQFLAGLEVVEQAQRPRGTALLGLNGEPETPYRQAAYAAGRRRRKARGQCCQRHYQLSSDHVDVDARAPGKVECYSRIMTWSAIAALLLALAVMLGAFGAHGLKDRLDAYSMDVYQKAVFYHFIHALGLLVVTLSPRT